MTRSRVASTPITVSVRLRDFARKVSIYWVVLVVVGSFLPGPWKLFLGTKPYVPNHPVEIQHRLAHFGIFGITALIFILAGDRRIDHAPRAAMAFLLGGVIEVVQYATGFARVLEWWDLRDDLIAALVVYLLFEVITSGRHFFARRRANH